MKFMCSVIILFLSIYCVNAQAADSATGDSIPPRAKELSKDCDLEARNALIHENIKLVEEVCMKAVEEIEKSGINKEHMINPILNLAFSYTLASQFDKATPLYKRARGIREKLYEPGSSKIKEIDDLILRNEEAKRHYK